MGIYQMSNSDRYYIICRAKIKKEKLREETLHNKLLELEKNLDGNEDSYLEYLVTKREWENLLKSKTYGIILRSKAKWIEEGEKNSKYFLNLEKINYNSKHITKLINDKGEEIIEPQKILDEQKKFYMALYQTKLQGTEIEIENSDIFLEQEIPSISK